MKDDRRNFIKKGASLTAALSVSGFGTFADSGVKKSKNTPSKSVKWPVTESPETQNCVLEQALMPMRSKYRILSRWASIMS